MGRQSDVQPLSFVQILDRDDSEYDMQEGFIPHSSFLHMGIGLNEYGVNILGTF